MAKKKTLGQKVSRKPEQMVTMPVDEFFDILRESSWDRPGAFFAYAGVAKVKNPRELMMHAYPFPDNSKESKKAYLRKIFKGNIPRTLLSKYWDT